MRPVYTIGHSTRSAEEFLEILQAFQIECLADIRTTPRSRRNPQFEINALRDSMAAAGISYVHMRALGGRRRPKQDSSNTAWRNDSFRGYADYMQTPEFVLALEELIQLAQDRRTVIMCAEAVPWRCHRSLVADALVARGLEAIDVFSAINARPHQLPAWARVENGRVTYPAT